MTQHDIYNLQVNNLAYATADQSPPVYASVAVPIPPRPQMTVVKTSTTSTFSAPGVSIPYAYKVTNTGNVTLTSAITVSDNKIASVSCPALPAGGLAPGAFITCTGSYTTTQADLDAGGITNTASAKSGSTTSPTVTLTIKGNQTPALGIVKSSTAKSFTKAGEVLPYSYVVTNLGNVTLTSAITVSDDKIATVSCPALPTGGLVPGAAITCTANYTVLQADLDSGSITNVASAKSGPTTSPTATLTITGNIHPDFTITKTTPTPTAVNNGDGTFTTTFQVAALNTGNIDLTNIKLTDNYASTLPAGAFVTGASFKSLVSSTRGALKTGNPGYDAKSTSPELIKLPGESLAVGETITAVFTITFDPGPNPSGTRFNNTAIGRATLLSGTTTVYSESKTSAAANAFKPSLPLIATKTTPKPEINVGGLVPYTITVRNIGADSSFGSYTVVDTLPAGMTVAARPSGTNWDCSATVIGAAAASCTWCRAGPTPPWRPRSPPSWACRSATPTWPSSPTASCTAGSASRCAAPTCSSCRPTPPPTGSP